MLRNDPIVLRYPKYLPTEEEVEATRELLQKPENEELWTQLCENIALGGCPTSSLWRFCWQARQDHHFGPECAKAAVGWVRDCVKGRQKCLMNGCLSSGSIFPASFRKQYSATVPFSFHGADKQGHPLYIARYGKMDLEAFRALWEAGERIKEEHNLAVNGCVLFHLRAMEYLTKVVMGELSRQRGHVVDRILSVVDLTGFTSRHVFDGPLKAFLGSVAGESKYLFPETIHAIVVANVPWVISKAGWPIAKSFMHPVTQAKIEMLASMSELRKKLRDLVDEGDLPPYLGGSCSCAECTSASAGGSMRGGSLWEWDDRMGHFEPKAPLRPVAPPRTSDKAPADPRARRYCSSRSNTAEQLCCARSKEADEDTTGPPPVAFAMPSKEWTGEAATATSLPSRNGEADEGPAATRMRWIRWPFRFVVLVAVVLLFSRNGWGAGRRAS